MYKIIKRFHARYFFFAAIMANAITVELTRLLECPICRGIFDEPTAFPCLHVFCRSCINRLKQKSSGSTLGYMCPVCQRFADMKDLRIWSFVYELIGIAARVDEHKKLCTMCTTRIAQFRFVLLTSTYSVRKFGIGEVYDSTHIAFGILNTVLSYASNQ